MTLELGNDLKKKKLATNIVNIAFCRRRCNRSPRFALLGAINRYSIIVPIGFYEAIEVTLDSSPINHRGFVFGSSFVPGAYPDFFFGGGGRINTTYSNCIFKYHYFMGGYIKIFRDCGSRSYGPPSPHPGYVPGL